MSVLRTGRHPLARTFAAALLVIHGLAAGTVGFAHAGEGLATPPAIESHHSDACVVLHDPARCPSCQLGTGGPAPQPQRHALARDGTGYHASAVATVVRPARALSRATPPRAPPVFSA